MNKYFNFIKLNQEIYDLARKMEFENKIEIGFYDYIHLAICVYHKLILVTRDKDLIELASNYVEVKKPEELTFI